MLTGAAVATAAGAGPLDVIPGGAVVIDRGRIAWAGPWPRLPREWRSAPEHPTGGGLITPGLVECHTYLPGSGLPGSGSPGSADLGQAARWAWWLIGQGVTTLEVKAAFGSSPDDPLGPLRLAGQLRSALPVRVLVTLLAGSSYPPGTDPEDYVLRVCDELLPAAIEAGGFDFVEVYCEEEGGISMEDASTIMETVYRRKIPTRVSADRVSDSAGGALAPAFYAKSAAYLNHTDDVSVTAMGKAGTTAVLVPSLPPPEGRPPVGMFRENGVPMAVSAGFDPAAGGLVDPRSAAYLARVLYGLTEAEAFAGITTAAARALALGSGSGSGSGTGTLAAGSLADLAVWDLEQPADLVSWLGAPPCREVWAAGRRLDLPGRLRSLPDPDAEESW